MDLNPETVLSNAPHGAEYGRLDNGLTYYVALNTVPEKRAELLLAVKVGSVIEQEAEQGVAHMIEHLAFSATETYKNHEIITFLARIGAEIGPCLNASTSEDDTVYEFSIPLDNYDVLDEAISIFLEFAAKIRISIEDLDKERGPVMEEYRDSRDAQGRENDAQLRLMMKDSKYADCSFVGLEKEILNVSADTVKLFYKKWYHTRHMAVIAVGDFVDTKRVVESIKTHFGSIIPPNDYMEIPRFEVPPHKETQFLCYVDPEAMDTSVVLICKSPVSEKGLVKSYTRSIVARMFYLSMSRRLFIISEKRNRPFRSCTMTEYEPARPIKAYIMKSSCYKSGVLSALESMLSEVSFPKVVLPHEVCPLTEKAMIMKFKREREQMLLKTLSVDLKCHYCFNVRTFIGLPQTPVCCLVCQSLLCKPSHGRMVIY